VGHTSFAGQDCRTLDDCQGQGTLIPARPQCDDPTFAELVCLRCLVATGGTLQHCAKSFEYRRSQFRRQVSRGCRVLVQARAKKDATEKEKPGAATDAKMDDAPAAPEVSSPAHSFSARTVQRHAALCSGTSHCHRWHTARWCAPRGGPAVCCRAHDGAVCCGCDAPRRVTRRRRWPSTAPTPRRRRRNPSRPRRCVRRTAQRCSTAERVVRHRSQHNANKTAKHRPYSTGGGRAVFVCVVWLLLLVLQHVATECNANAL
jgi:hypothetical protein